MTLRKVYKNAFSFQCQIFSQIIRSELYRNVLLATLAISVATVCLLSNLVGSIFVILCVFLTLCNVSGIIYFWGLNIDTVTCTVLIVCIGLSVDFSVHVIHAFIHSEGSSRDERVKNALKVSIKINYHSFLFEL